ncbi:hypothetical protein BDN71DRAFT_355842 [Pleurotus eryngii]|uniref:Uncharacterized protein n=1 Tax=Pleurotus eryngii TaxID=5323 RepID=A0A9P6A331_PLEER|nr:hypothetical protein BDN71DRAFT_355842 [Pleurotus eryngii]
MFYRYARSSIPESPDFDVVPLCPMFCVKSIIIRWTNLRIYAESGERFKLQTPLDLGSLTRRKFAELTYRHRLTNRRSKTEVQPASPGARVPQKSLEWCRRRVSEPQPCVSAFPPSERGQRRQCTKFKGWKAIPTKRTGYRIAHPPTTTPSNTYTCYLWSFYRMDTGAYTRSGSQLVNGQGTTLTANSFNLRFRFTT